MKNLIFTLITIMIMPSISMADICCLPNGDCETLPNLPATQAEIEACNLQGGVYYGWDTWGDVVTDCFSATDFCGSGCGTFPLPDNAWGSCCYAGGLCQDVPNQEICECQGGLFTMAEPCSATFCIEGTPPCCLYDSRGKLTGCINASVMDCNYVHGGVFVTNCLDCPTTKYINYCDAELALIVRCTPFGMEAKPVWVEGGSTGILQDLENCTQWTLTVCPTTTPTQRRWAKMNVPAPESPGGPWRHCDAEEACDCKFFVGNVDFPSASNNSCKNCILMTFPESTLKGGVQTVEAPCDAPQLLNSCCFASKFPSDCDCVESFCCEETPGQPDYGVALNCDFMCNSVCCIVDVATYQSICPDCY
jgi:hypothetical protein